MKFVHPQMLFWLWALLPVACVMVYGIKSRRKIIDRFVKPELLPRMVPGFSQAPAWIRSVLVLLGLGLCIFALAGPQAGFKWEKTRQRGVDIMIALDCSRSMLASDVSPSRLERAKREIIDLTRLLHSDRAGLVAFSGRAVLQCPLTMDYGAFQVFLDVLGPDYLPVGGTDLAAALSTCYRGFDAEADTQKAIIVITDGEDTTQQGKDALDTVIETLSKEKIKVFAIGVGDPSGAPVPDETGGFKRDAGGAIVMSRVDEAGLKRIAGATGGRYVRSVAGDMDLEQIYGQDILGTMAKSTFIEGKKKVWENRFQWALLPGLLLLLAELFVGKRRGRRTKIPKAAAGCAVLCLCVLASAGPARAELFKNPVKQGVQAYEKGDFQKAKKLFIDAQLDNPDDPRLYYDIGTAAYAAGEYALAKDNFSQVLASGDKALRKDALYNLANTRYKMGDLKGAVKDYERLLKDFPEDTQAKENLEFVRKKLEELKKNENQQDKPGDSENRESKDKDSSDKKQGQGAEKNDPGKQDQGQQDQGKQSQQQSDQNKQDQNKQDQNKQDQNKQPGNQDDQGQNQENASSGHQGQQDNQDGQKKGMKEPDSSQAGQGQKNGPDNKEKQAAQAQRTDAGQSAGQATPPLSPEAAKMLESKLNRLTDMPGRALMPAGRAQTIERDW